HCISQWTGSFFQETSLIKVGLHIHLAHDGTPCPSSSMDYLSDVFQWSDTDDDIDHDYPEGHFIPLVRDLDQPTITVVDKSGVHSLSICYCHCPGGLGFMVSDKRYKSHLAIAYNHIQRSDCNNH
ncbi:hypothetical protein BDR04DRAFT_1020843, partial [Suillus decipiens]